MQESHGCPPGEAGAAIAVAEHAGEGVVEETAKRIGDTDEGAARDGGGEIEAGGQICGDVGASAGGGRQRGEPEGGGAHAGAAGTASRRGWQRARGCGTVHDAAVRPDL